MKLPLIIVRGGGDLATGTIYKLVKCGFPVLVLEVPQPAAIRRYVAFSECVYDGTAVVEDMVCTLAHSTAEAKTMLSSGVNPVMLVDPAGERIAAFTPFCVVDAILAKKNLGTTLDMAPLVIALGPGFTAGIDAHCVIETKRGHRLGRILTEGSAIPNTGIPGVIAGHGADRVIHAEHTGILRNIRRISDIVEQGEPIARIELADGSFCVVRASLTGVLRGLIRDGYPVTTGFKIADIDPRLEEQQNCYTISDKARCIAGGVAEGIFRYL